MDITITSLDRNDLRALSALCRQALLSQDAFAPEDLEHTIFNDPFPDPAWTLVARASGEMVGVLNGALRQRKGQAKTGLVKLFAVLPAARRQGVATALFDRFEQMCRDAGAEAVRVGSQGPLYFFGGVDPRYTEAVIFLMNRGYEKSGDGFYLGVDLGQPLPRYDALIDKLAAQGIVFERPRLDQREEVREWVRATFGDGWAHETDLGFEHDPVSVWIARAKGAVCGFAASNATGREYFGPTGVGPDFRLKGIGRVLVVKCMEDMQGDGRRVGWIPTGLARVRYYHNAAGARVMRTFWAFGKTLAE